MDQFLIQIVAADQDEVSLEYMADLVRLLPPEDIVELLEQFQGFPMRLRGLPQRSVACSRLPCSARGMPSRARPYSHDSA